MMMTATCAPTMKIPCLHRLPLAALAALLLLAPITNAADESALLDTYCSDCHNDDQWAGSLSFAGLAADDLQQGNNLAVWEKILRKTSLDELPQLWCILKGDMSFVGPRPALYNQTDLIEARTAAGVHVLTPGLTGWAQVNGRDELPLAEKVRYDAEYLQRQSLAFDLRILVLTVWKVIRRDGVTH